MSRSERWSKGELNIFDFPAIVSSSRSCLLLNAFVSWFCSAIGQVAEDGAAGDGDGWVGNGRRSQLSLLCDAGSADGGTPVVAETPGFVLPGFLSGCEVANLPPYVTPPSVQV